MSESNADFQKRLDAETDAAEVERLAEDRKRGLLNERALAKLDAAIGNDGAQERLAEIEKKIRAVEAIAADVAS